MIAKTCVLAVVFGLGLSACAGSSSRPREPRYTIVRPSDSPPEVGGVSPDKEAEIQLVLQQREPSARKCYQDILNERQDKTFQGTIRLLIHIDASGRASSVKVVGGTLNDNEVKGCLVETIKAFEFPQLAQGGEVQYEYMFRPQY